MYEYETYDPETGKIQTVYKLEDCLNAIRIRNDSNEKRIKRLEEEIKRLREEHYKDNELQKMKSKLERMEKDYYRGFPISEEDEKAIRDWEKEHVAKMHGLKTTDDRMRISGAIGGNWSYEFIPTSIGVSGCVKCNSCGEKFEFQEIG